MNQNTNNHDAPRKQGDSPFVIRLGKPMAAPVSAPVPMPAPKAAQKAVPEKAPVFFDTSNAPRQTFGQLLLEMVKFTIIAVVIITPIRFFVAQPFIVQGESMDPTFGDGQYLVINEMKYRSQPPERGDVIVFKYPRDTSKYFIKRIIGLPNEIVHIKNGNITITTPDKKTIALTEPYIKNLSFDNLSEELGKDEYFVMGDNRTNSLDSRSWGPVPKANITGDVLARIFPFTLAGILPGKETQ